MVAIDQLYLIGDHDMAIRTLAAAAALVAVTAPAFAETGENIALLDDSVSTQGFEALIALAPAGIIAGIVVIATTTEQPKGTVSTN